MSRIAIVGLACLFPGARDLASFWQNIVDGVDAITEVPESRWDHSFYDPNSTAVDRFYCNRGGFVDTDATFDPLAFGVVPNAVDAIEPEQLLTLKIGYEALKDAGYDSKPFSRDRTGVIVGRGNYVSAGVLRLEQHVRLLPQVERTLRDLFPDLPESVIDAARTKLQKELSHYGPDVASGLIPNLVASRLANRLDLHGPAFTIDAACASAAIAIEQGCSSLANGETDMMLVGGVHLSHDLTFWATFCQLGALSRNGVSRPLSADADGILAGEGVGMAVLKRLDDALADGDRIYAVVEGVGSSSDGRSSSLVAPASVGQLMAMEKAWRHVSFSRDDLGLIETHGTGTPTGDQVELETLKTFFGASATAADAAPVAGSVKSMIGHAMPASGMASLIKTALAIHHGILPPTLHCETPHPLLAESGFRAIGQSEVWSTPREERIAAFNTFGFGGINGHVVLRGLPEPSKAPACPGLSLPPVLMLSANSQEELVARLDLREPDPAAGNGAHRLTIVAPSEKKLALARKAILSGKAWRGRQQIWYSPDGFAQSGGKIAFVFPGADSSFAPNAEDIAKHFALVCSAYCTPMDPATQLPYVVRGVLNFNLLMFDALSKLDIEADGMLGHSIGEWSAMAASGILDRAEAERRYSHGDPEQVSFPDLPYLAASCSEERLRTIIDGIEGIDVSHDNCPHQSIACGRREAVEEALARLRVEKIFAQVLPIVAGFHSPLFAPYAPSFRGMLTDMQMSEPRIPVWSIASAEPFPTNATEKMEVAARQLIDPVLFQPAIKAMYEAGFRVFIQVGTGSLSGFIDDILTGQPHLAIDSHSESRTGLEQLQHLSAALWTEGYPFDGSLLGIRDRRDVPASTSAAVGRKLSLGVPLLRLATPLDTRLGTSSVQSGFERPTLDADDRVGRMLSETLTEIEQAGRDVLALWQQRRAGKNAPRSSPHIDTSLRKLLDVDRTIPWVDDHAFYPQPAGWPIRADRRPVVPLTMEVMLVREALESVLAEQGFGHLHVIEFRDIKAFNWLDVTEPVTVTITLRSTEEFAFDAEIEGYFSARLIVAERYPAADAPQAVPLSRPRETRASASDLYRDGWMFHGPAYQGVSRFEAIGDNGIDGILKTPSGSGSLLDNMGQLAGYWVMEQPDNCLAMPIGVDRICFLGPDPSPGEMMRCEVRVTTLNDLECATDHVLRDTSGKAVLTMQGWRTRRYHMDDRFWTNSRQISTHEISQMVPPNIAIFEDRFDTALMRDYICRRYLTAEERASYDSLPPRRRREWLNGRVAAKDAVRSYLRQRGNADAIFPQEVIVENDAAGAPFVRKHVTDAVSESLYISLAHKGRFAVAMVGERPVGIDIERIEERTQGFADLAFTAQEQTLFAGETFDVACTRGWVVKEAMAKALRTGLQGRLHEFVIDQRDGDCFRVNGHWAVTHRIDDHIVGWLLEAPHDAAADGGGPDSVSMASASQVDA
ncbi:MAG: beta-ketoacyl synthase N-terminal-like domain-containing protein [Rhizobiaceae bacterium]